MSARVRAPAPSDSAIHARARSGPAGRTSSSGVSRSVTRCSSPACSRYAASASSRSGRSAASAGVSRRACSASSTASCRAPRAAAAIAAAATVGGERGVGPAGGEREMLGAQLRIADRAGERLVQRAPLGRVRALARGGAEQRVRGAHVLAVDAQQPGVDRRLDAVRAGGGHQLADLDVAAQRGGEQDPALAVGQRGDARAEDVLHGLGDDQLGADRRPAARGERAPELEREQRVAERRVRHAPQQRARDAHAEPPGEQPARGVEVERADVEPRERPATERALQRPHAARAAGEQEADRHAVEPPRGEAQGLGGRRVQPLQVVDRDQHRPGCRQRPQPVEHAERDRARLRGVGRGLATQQRDLERLRLRRGQPGERVRADAVEEVDQRGERQPRLGVAGPRGEDLVPARPRAGDPGLPQGRLADAGRPGDQQRPPVAGEERVERRELRLAGDDAGCRAVVHAATLSDRGPGQPRISSRRINPPPVSNTNEPPPL